MTQTICRTGLISSLKLNLSQTNLELLGRQPKIRLRGLLLRTT